MLETIIAFLNGRLNQPNMFEKFYGLAEQMKKAITTEDDVDVEITFPAVAIGKDEHDQIEIDEYQGVIYHRMAENTLTEQLDIRVSGCENYERKTYKMRSVAFVKRDIFGCDDAYADEKLAQNVENAYRVSNDKQTREALGVNVIKINITNTNVDRYSIWDDEFNNIPMKATFDYAVVAVDYDIIVEAPASCFKTFDCDGGSSPFFGVTVTDNDNPKSPIQVPSGSSYSCVDIRILDFFFEAGAGDSNIVTIGTNQTGTFDLDNPTLTNVDSYTVKRNGLLVTGEIPFPVGSTLEIDIVRTNDADDSEVVFQTV